ARPKSLTPTAVTPAGPIPPTPRGIAGEGWSPWPDGPAAAWEARHGGRHAVTGCSASAVVAAGWRLAEACGWPLPRAIRERAGWNFLDRGWGRGTIRGRYRADLPGRSPCWKRPPRTAGRCRPGSRREGRGMQRCRWQEDPDRRL